MFFCNIDFKIKNKSQLFYIANEQKLKCIVPVNAQVIVLANENKRLLDFINRQDAVFDGQVPLNVAKKKKNQFKQYEKLSGSEIVYDFCEFATDNHKKIFFLGGSEESNRMSVERIKELYKDIEIEGYSPKFETYPFSGDFNESCLKEIKAYEPEILFIGFGAPKQEYFTDDNYDALNEMGVKYVISCGGTFDFISGKFKRAPKWVQNIGLEGLYRLLKQFSIMRIKRIIESFGFYKYVNDNMI